MSVCAAPDTIPTPDTSDLGVKIFVEGCSDIDPVTLKNILKIEMSAFSPQTARWVHGTKPKVSITCREETLTFRLDDANSDRYIERNIDINEAVSLAIQRFIVLAVVELLETGGEELQESPPVPPPVTPAEPPTEEDDKEPIEPEFMLQLTIAPNLWLGGDPVWLSYGGSLGLELALREWLVPTLDLDVNFGFNEVSMGRIDALQFSGAGLLLFRIPVKKMELLLGLGFRIGAVNLTGTPDENTGLAGEKKILPWQSPCADLRSTFFVNDRLQLGLNIQGGWYSMEAHATVNGDPIMSLKDGWMRVGFIGKVKLW